MGVCDDQGPERVKGGRGPRLMHSSKEEGAAALQNLRKALCSLARVKTSQAKQSPHAPPPHSPLPPSSCMTKCHGPQPLCTPHTHPFSHPFSTSFQRSTRNDGPPVCAPPGRTRGCRWACASGPRLRSEKKGRVAILCFFSVFSFFQAGVAGFEPAAVMCGCLLQAAAVWTARTCLHLVHVLTTRSAGTRKLDVNVVGVDLRGRKCEAKGCLSAWENN